MILTDDQEREISKQAAFYDTEECPAAGLLSYRVYPPGEWGGAYAAGTVCVDFTYIYDDGPDEPASYGLETTVFAPDGSVISSQDFG